MKQIPFQLVQLVMNAESLMWQIRSVLRMRRINNMLIVLSEQFVAN